MKIKLAPYGKKSVSVKKGDFVRPVGWCFDVWAEVLNTYGAMPQYKSVQIPSPYLKGNYETVHEYLPGAHTLFFQIAEVCTRAQLKRKNPRIVHLKDGSYGYDLTRPHNANNPRMKAGFPKFLLTSVTK